MTPQPQQEWIISDKDYHIALEYFHLVARPLSDELKKERERVLDKYLELLVSCRFELDGEIVVKMSAIRNVREELRGEP